MPNTPAQRSTRSGSNAQSFTLNDIKALIDSSKSDVTNSVKLEMEKLRDMITPLLIRIGKLEEQNQTLQSRINQLEEKQDKTTTVVSNGEEGSQEMLIGEFEERHRRQDYLIFSGLPESNSGPITERKVHDQQAVRDVAHALGFQNFVPFELSRIGKINTHTPRLLRVRCPDRETKMTLLSTAKNLRDSWNFKRVYINPDLTRMQREKNKKLRTELKLRREKGEKLTIRGGQIVELQKQHFQ